MTEFAVLEVLYHKGAFSLARFGTEFSWMGANHHVRGQEAGGTRVDAAENRCRRPTGGLWRADIQGVERSMMYSPPRRPAARGHGAIGFGKTCSDPTAPSPQPACPAHNRRGSRTMTDATRPHATATHLTTGPKCPPNRSRCAVARKTASCIDRPSAVPVRQPAQSRADDDREQCDRSRESGEGVQRSDDSHHGN